MSTAQGCAVGSNPARGEGSWPHRSRRGGWDHTWVSTTRNPLHRQQLARNSAALPEGEPFTGLAPSPC